MALTIRTATAADLDAVTPLFDAYRQFFTGKPDLAISRGFLEQRLERGESVVLAAFEGGDAAGFLQLYPLFSSWYCKRQWFLSDLYVAEPFRRHGVGKRLVEACIDFAARTQARAVLVELPFSEPHLVDFYGALGFAKDPVFDLYRLVARQPESAEGRK
ncbi:MAG: GNAT family N-acetyltransferase [Candidatus Eremiobacteraeota bacterium]|nr:GNAT family N-acetyltransferase [Candidatus Eremiobacteraeota bacterium]